MPSGPAATPRCAPVDLPPEISRALRRAYPAPSGSPFAGIDLMRMADGRYYCFEVNPQPAFSYFEANTRQPIAAAVAKYLMGKTARAARRAPGGTS